MKKVMLVLIGALLLIPVIAKAELGDWKMIVVFHGSTQYEEIYNHGTARALVSILQARLSAAPGHSEDVWTDWVQDGRQGEDPAEWYFSPIAVPINHRFFYAGGTDQTESVALVTEDTDYEMSSKWEVNLGEEGEWSCFIHITNRVFDNNEFDNFIPYCDMEFARTPLPVCP